MKLRSVESRFVIGPSNLLSAGVYDCTFQPGNFTGWVSEGVKVEAYGLTETTLQPVLVASITTSGIHVHNGVFRF